MTVRAPSTLEKVFATALYVPLGLGAKFIDDLPTNITRAKQQIDFARFIGKMAVDRSVADFGDRLRAVPNDDPPDPVIDVEVTELQETTDTPSATDAVQRLTPVADLTPVVDLALVDYDQLPASHIISKLDGLTDDEVAAIQRYEAAHRGRRTVLGKIDQLQSEPA